MKNKKYTNADKFREKIDIFDLCDIIINGNYDKCKHCVYTKQTCGDKDCTDGISEWLNNELKMTNRQKINSMSDKEFVEWVEKYSITANCNYCIWQKHPCMGDYMYDCKQGVEKWLNKECSK